MRVVVVGASGNVGTSLLRSLADEPAVDSVIGLCRRLPDASFPKVEWRTADITSAPLRPHFEGADAVVHLAWLIQPARDQELVRAVNVDGSARVFRAAAEAGVGTLVYASSVGAYAHGPKDRRVDESWPTTGIPTSFYSRHKAEVERLLDRFEREHGAVRVVRLRPALIFKREAASGIRRLFAGPLVPGFLVRRELIPVVPATRRLVFQAVHSYDVGEAYRLALVGEARGPFNIAAEPVLDPAELGRLLGARPVPVPPGVLRAGAAASFKLRLQPSEVGWVDMGLGVPLMDAGRARRELGWEPKRSSGDALLDLFAGMREGAGLDTPPLEPGGAGPARIREFASGVGKRTG
jgi:UDP-glucose 4-epimerase